MRVFHREFGSRYDSYEFGYATYAAREEGDRVADIYASGFLPHSADPSVRDLFYMARSVRVPLAAFALSSENRRVLKKFDGAFSSIRLSAHELAEDAHFLPCFLAYFRQRHGERVMSEERARGILATPLPLVATRYERDGSIAGYALEILDGDMAHYWYSCYTSDYDDSSLGMWLMLDAVRRAQDEGRRYIYLGTAYGSKGRYKTNFRPLEFWDGSEWVDDLPKLKELLSAD